MLKLEQEFAEMKQKYVGMYHENMQLHEQVLELSASANLAPENTDQLRSTIANLSQKFNDSILFNVIEQPT